MSITSCIHEVVIAYASFIAVKVHKHQPSGISWDVWPVHPADLCCLNTSSLPGRKMIAVHQGGAVFYWNSPKWAQTIIGLTWRWPQLKLLHSCLNAVNSLFCVQIPILDVLNQMENMTHTFTQNYQLAQQWIIVHNLDEQCCLFTSDFNLVTLHVSSKHCLLCEQQTKKFSYQPQ